MNNLPPSPRPAPTDTALDALAWAGGAGVGAAVVRAARARRRQRLVRRTLGAVSIVAVLAVGVLALRPRESAPPAAPSVVARGVETRTLADGSVVELRAGAALDVEFSAGERRVMLRAGEAHFAVRWDLKTLQLAHAHDRAIHRHFVDFHTLSAWACCAEQMICGAGRIGDRYVAGGDINACRRRRGCCVSRAVRRGKRTSTS